MVIEMPKIGNQKYSKSLYLGRQFENNSRIIRFDITEWVNDFGNGTVELLHMRHGDTVPYSVPFSRVDADGNEDDSTGGYVLWTVSSIDTAQAFSDGQAELRYYSENGDDYFLKSETYRTVVSEALGTPLPEEDWYKSLISKLDSIDDIVDEVTAIRDEILSGEIGGGVTESNYTTGEKNKLAGIEDGAEANVIVSVSVNDIPVEIVNKNVSLRIPTKVSELTNDSGYLSEHQNISGKLDANKVGVAGGVAQLDENGIIVSAQLPSFVDDVLEYDSMSDFPQEGESGKIYVATDVNLSYRWSGSVYVEISPSIALGETSSTAYRGDRGKAAYDHSQATGNPHETTKADIGLENVDNTSDVNKPVSTAQQAALDLKVDKVSGKGLSTNDYTTAEKSKLSGVASGATANAPATAAPLMDGTAAVGTSAKYAREDHRHPTDTSRASAADLTALVNYVKSLTVYKTASGNPATFADAKAANVQELIVTITPRQSEPGANLFTATERAYVNASGTLIDTDNNVGSWISVTPNKIYTLSTQVSVSSMAAMFYDANKVPVSERFLSSNATSLVVTAPSGAALIYAYFNARNSSGQESIIDGSDAVFLPRFEEGSARNNRPISGATSVTVRRTGKNLLPLMTSGGELNGVTFTAHTDEAGNVVSVTGGGQSTATTFFKLGPAFTLPPGDYVLSGNTPKSHGTGAITLILNASERIACDRGETAFSLSAAQRFTPMIRLNSGMTLTDADVFQPLLRYASESDATFAPYQAPQSAALPLVDSNGDSLTVYGGELNVTTGALTVTWGLIASYDGETLPGRWMSDRDVYSAGATPTTGAQVAYELAAPVTYRLTPAQLTSLAGYNSVMTDADTLSVTYRADISLAQ